MGKINSRRKGAAGEREFANLLRSHGIHARRGQQFSGGPESPDVVADLPGFHFEVKRTERLNLYDAMAQAIGDMKKGDIPVVAHRKNNEEWVVVLPAEDFMEMAKVFVQKEEELYG